MKKTITFFKTMLLTVMLLLLGSKVWAVDVEFNFSTQGYINAQNVPSGTINSDLSFEATIGGQNPAKYYTTGTGLRVYSGGSFIVKPSNGITITNVTLTFSGSTYTFKSGDSNPTIWTGSSNSDVTFTVSQTCRLQKVAITYTNGTSTQVATPTFTITGATKATDIYYNTANVSLSSTTDGASIYYTTNGDTPTTSSTLYSGAFDVTSTSTIKAIAVKSGLDNSAVSEKTINIVAPASATLPYSQAFNNTLGDWYSYRVSGAGTTNPWTTNAAGAYINAYVSSGSNNVEAWLISPKFTGVQNNSLLSFSYKNQYGGTTTGSPLTIKYSTDYLGYGDPNAATWTTLTTVADATGTAASAVTPLSNIAIPASGNVYVAFVDAETANYVAWWISNLSIVAPLTCITPTYSFAAANLTKLTTDAAFTNVFTSNNTSPKVWSSTNEAVATVDATGLVTIHSAGSTSIKVNQAADATYCAVVDASYVLTVTTPIIAEPSNHPTDFAATVNSVSQITVSWTDATGAQMPDGYLVKASTGAPTPPVDGTPESDETLVKNITQGTREAYFIGLSASTTYNFSIWPYTNNGAAIDYKTDGVIETVSATTKTPLGIPVATAATDITSTGFTANWEAAVAATEYEVNVFEKTAGENTTDLFISEYVEGTSSNKYIEIFNGTGSSVDLSDYRLQLYANGATNTTNDVQLSGILENGSAIVYKNNQASLTLPQGVNATTNTAVNFSGDDAVALYKISTSSYVDIFGRIGERPEATWWGIAPKVTLDKTLVRKGDVKSGVTTNPASGFPTLDTEWLTYNVDNVSNLGSHRMVGASEIRISGSPFTVTETSKTVSGLKPGTGYFYTVVAKNPTGRSAASNKINVTTTNSIVVNNAVNASTLADCPTCNVTVANTGTFTIDAAKTYNSITVESGGKLNTTEPLTVGDLVLKAVKDESSFSSILDATITATSAKLFKTIDDTKWYYMAFPCDVTVADITKSNGDAMTGLGTDWFIKYYDGEQRGNNGTAQTNWKHIEAIPTLTANRGYIFGLKTGTVELSIPLNSSVLTAESTDKNIAVAANTGSAGATHQGWNLIGQPYMSKYNARSNGSSPNYMIMPNPDGKTYTQTSKVAGTLPTDLKPFAAYFVQVGAAGNIGFGKNGRQNVPASVAAEVLEYIKLNLTTSTGTDDTYLILDNNQSAEYQIGEDMVKWLGTGTDVPQVYTVLGDINYAFNALPMASVVNLPIGFYTKNAGASTISANALQAPGLSKLLLTDKKENITTDLLVSDYSFNATAGTDNSRFVISAQRISTGDQISLIDAPSVISSNGKLVIDGLSPKTNIRIYDATGRIVMNKVATERRIEIPLQVVGMYAVHIDAGIKNWTIKIVNNK